MGQTLTRFESRQCADGDAGGVGQGLEGQIAIPTKCAQSRPDIGKQLLEFGVHALIFAVSANFLPASRAGLRRSFRLASTAEHVERWSPR